MSFFKDTVAPPREAPAPASPSPAAVASSRPTPPEAPRTAPSTPADTIHRPAERAEPRAEAKESFIAAELAIEGKIEGVGNVRIAGRFNGDVQIQGNLGIDSGAHLTGLVHARNVIISGELTGNVDDAQRVELLATGVLVGDVKAGSLTVAAGSKMRGNVEFGWDDKGVQRVERARGAGPNA